MEVILFPVIAYLLGSIPTAVWIGLKFYNTDVRNHGSKNAGATNTFRVLGKKPGIIVLFIDIIKGALAVTLPLILFSNSLEYNELVNIQLVCGITAIIGHIFPVFARFNGGKGVATSLGVVVGIHPPTAIVCIGLFLIFFLFTQMVSVGALIAAIAFPLVLNFIFGNDNVWLTAFSIILSVAVIFAHRQNIKRLVNGEENKMNLFNNNS